MELRELNNQGGPIQLNGPPSMVSPNNFDINANKQQQHQQMLATNIHNQIQNRFDNPMAPPSIRNVGQIRYNTTNNNNSNNNNGTATNSKVSATKQHRELPVDVPDSFVGMAKQSPRYPPPKPNRQISPPMPLNNNNNNNINNQFNTFNSQQNHSSATPFNQQQMNRFVMVNNNNNTNTTSTNENSNNNITTNNHQTNSQPALPPIAQSTATSIMTHNSSLRSSIKLKQLEKSRNQHVYGAEHMQPAINQAFELNEDDDGQSVKLNINTTTNNKRHQVSNVNPNPNPQQQPQPQQNIADFGSLYNRLQNNLNGEFSNVAVDGKLAKLLSIYNTLIKTQDRQLRIPSLTSRFQTVSMIGHTNGHEEIPMVFKLSDLLYSVIQILRTENLTDDIAELLSILYKHEFDGVCSAFDRISQSFEFAKSSSTPSPQHTLRMDQNGFQDQRMNHNNNNITNNSKNLVTTTLNQNHGRQLNQNGNGHYLSDYHNNFSCDNVQMNMNDTMFHNGMLPMTEVDLSEDGCTRTVHIDKSSNQALGATIKNDGNRVIIGRIVCGGVAHKSGVLNEGDEILEVNDIPMRGKNINDVVGIIEGLNGTLFMTIVTAKFTRPTPTNLREKIFVRAFFDFDGETDEFIPCRELGLSFKKGEILSIIDQSDEIWWQANREHDSDARLAGLIPSLKHLDQRENHLSSHDTVPNYFNMKHEKRNFVTKLFQCPKGTSAHSNGRVRKKELPNMPFGPKQIPYYEEVHLYYPDKYRKRPIILVGPKMIGQHEIRAKLLQDSSRFAKVVSHTSRPKQDHERNGVDYHFVTRAQFEADMKAGRFIECGQFQNQYYGTSLDAMREVVRSKKICVHLVNTPSLFNFRNGRAGSELRPFFVFVKPDDSHPDKLRNIVATYSQPKTNIEENIRAIMAEVQLIEAHYLPYFDLVLTVSNVDRAYQELLSEIVKIEAEPQWIPMFWQESPSS